MSLTFHDFALFPLGIPSGYTVVPSSDLVWEIADTALGRRLLARSTGVGFAAEKMQLFASTTMSKAYFEAEYPFELGSFQNISIGLICNGVEILALNGSNQTLFFADSSEGDVDLSAAGITGSIICEIEFSSNLLTMIVKNGVTLATIATKTKVLTRGAGEFALKVLGYPSTIDATVKKIGWEVVPTLVLSDFSDVLEVQLDSNESPRLREYETQLPEEAPPRLQDFYSQRLLAVLGAVKDDVVADSLDAIAEIFASTASEKRLLEIGADRLIDRYPTESLASYRVAVLNASRIQEWRGTAKGIQDEIARFGYAATYIPLRNAAPAHWAEFILILRNGRIQRSLGTGGPWDIGMSLIERDALLKLVRRWKNSDERLAMISYSLGNSDFWGEGGTWGDNTTWVSGGTKVIYARPYAWGDHPNDTWNSSQGTWGDTDTYPVQEG